MKVVENSQQTLQLVVDTRAWNFEARTQAANALNQLVIRTRERDESRTDFDLLQTEVTEANRLRFVAEAVRDAANRERQNIEADSQRMEGPS